MFEKKNQITNTVIYLYTIYNYFICNSIQISWAYFVRCIRIIIKKMSKITERALNAYIHMYVLLAYKVGLKIFQL